MELGIFDIACAQLRQRRIDGFDENPALYFRNTQGQVLLGLTLVCRTGAFLNPFTVGVKVRIPNLATSVEGHVGDLSTSGRPDASYRSEAAIGSLLPHQNAASGHA